MTDLGMSFDVDNTDSNVGQPAPVPPDTYEMIITNSALKCVKNKPTEKYLWLEHTIISGQFQGRKIFNNLNMWHPNPETVRIAKGHFAGLCKACGKRGSINDSAEVHGIPFRGKVGVDAKNPAYINNRVEEYIHEKAATSARNVGFVPPVAVAPAYAAPAINNGYQAPPAHAAPQQAPAQPVAAPAPAWNGQNPIPWGNG